MSRLPEQQDDSNTSRDTNRINSQLSTSITTSNAETPILPRLLSASVGSIITALAVTPLDVVKVRQQARLPSQSKKTKLPSNVTPCPRGCGTFILNNGLMECLVPKSAVPYFDSAGQPVLEKNDSKNNNNNNNNKNKLDSKSPSTSKMSKNPSSLRSKPDLGTFAMVRRIFLREGFGGIYAGLAPTLIMSVPNVALYFTAYDEIVSRLHYLSSSSSSSSSTSGTSSPSSTTTTTGRTFDSIWIPLVGGSSSRMLASVTTAPLELIRTRQAARKGSAVQSASGGSRGVFNELQTIVRNDGFVSLYRGLGPTLWRDVPFSALYWLCLETFKSEWKERRHVLEEETHSEAFVRAFVTGASAGMIAAACTTPFDVVKTRQQMISETVASVGHFDAAAPATASVSVSCHHDGAVVYQPVQGAGAGVTKNRSSRKPSTFAWMQNIVETEGITGLWRGNQARMLKVAPACAIMISCYEFGKRVME